MCNSLLPTDKMWFLVHEQLVEKNGEELSDKREVIEEDSDYEKGFIKDTPFILDKRNNKAIISKMGKTFENEKERLSKTKNSWFSIGFPFLYKCMDCAIHKPVILLVLKG